MRSETTSQKKSKLDQSMAKSSSKRQGILESHAAATNEKLTSAQIRTRASLSRKLKVTKQTIRRLERRSELYLSTLQEIAKATGVTVSLIVEFPGQSAVVLSGMGRVQRRKNAQKKPATSPKSKSKSRRAA
jgi:transcriptional regulator with XRE-family HTH domain